MILYNKPADVVTTHAVEDVLGRKNVFQDIMSRPSQQNVLPAGFPQGWHAVGRLDADTTGLLLLTNDGGLVHHVTNRVASSAKIPTEKRYEAIIMGHYEDDCEMFEQFRSVGVDIGGKNGGRTLPVQQIHAVGHPNHKSTIVSIALVEGKNRQIRRMFHSSGSGVMRLTRTAIGDELTLSMVPNEGDWCILRNEQIISALHWVPEGYTGKQQ